MLLPVTDYNNINVGLVLKGPSKVTGTADSFPAIPCT